jgi:hypothetical protein
LNPFPADLIEQFVRITAVHGGKCFRADNAVCRDAKQALGYYDPVGAGSPDPVDQDVGNFLAFDLICFPAIPVVWLQNAVQDIVVG